MSFRWLALSVCPFFQKGGWSALLIAISDGCCGSRFFEVGLRFSVSFLGVSACEISDGVQNKLIKVLPGFEIALQIDENEGRKRVCVVVWVRLRKGGSCRLGPACGLHYKSAEVGSKKGPRGRLGWP